jgi:hypothetical protein
MVHRSREKRPFRERNGREHPPPSPEVLAKTTPTTGFPEGVGGPENRGHLRRWRRGRDLNPRYGCPYAAFRVRCDRPLCHLSIQLIYIGFSDFHQTSNTRMLPELLPNTLFFALKARFGNLKSGIEPSCRVGLHGVRNVRIKVHRGGYGQVPQTLLRDFRMDSVSEQLSGVRVPRVMEAHPWDILEPVHQLAELVRQASRLQRFSIGSTTRLDNTQTSPPFAEHRV